MAELIIAGEAFNVVVEGDENAPVLMLSNSLGTNLHMWDKQVPALTEHFRVLRYDTRGHGGSVVTEGPYTIAELGQDAVTIMDALGFAKVHWLGLSMGGMIGQWLLTHVPDRIDRAVLANTGAQLGSPEFWNERIAIATDKGMTALAPAVIERWFTKEFRDHHQGEVEAIRAVLEATSPVGYAGCCAAIRDMDLLAALPSVTSPVLVVAGRQDPATPPGLGALIASAVPGAKLVTLDTAHLSNLEDAAGFNRAVIDFLTGDAAATAEPAEEQAAPAPKKPRRKPAAKKPEPVPAAPEETEIAAEPAAPPAEIAAEAEAEPEAPAAPAAPRRRAPAKKAAVKKAPAKKAAAKKAAAKKTPAKKAPAKKAAAKKAPGKKAAVKKSTARKAPAKKAAGRRAAGRGVAAKRAPAKKAAARKVAAPRKAVAKKTARKAAGKRVAVKKTAVKKTAAKKTAVRKSAPKKAIRKTAVKKTTRRPVGRRGPARKR